MNNHNRTLLATAQPLLILLDECGFQGVVCGGFARDVQYDKNAKDIDIAVGCAEHSIADLSDLVDAIGAKHGIRTYWTGEDRKVSGVDVNTDDPRNPDAAPSEPTEDDHLVQLVVQIPALRLDIIFYNTQHDAANLVAQHDCNLNQFVMAGTTPVFLGSFHPDKHGLRITKEGLHPGRIAYMEEKWEAMAPPAEWPSTFDLFE
ncbi:nucleotidyltransferase [Pseudomonas phage uligo]|uniref:Nucleotidyltransferase n=1 Tax=Pseudomonas phage uligo TaxID=2048979 RepID=A0A2H4P7T2_9CAUD|nr:nucleotidyltransferase [Pseudomonas phage uligo]ATW58218.1 putative nucleotidyltransferase [Pseudomonas phage uligo]